MRNLLPANYPMPHFGAPLDCAEDGQGNQPNLCTLDQEIFAQPCQPATGMYRPGSFNSPGYSINFPNALDRAVQHIQSMG